MAPPSFAELEARHGAAPIHGCPGRYRLRGVADLDVAAVMGGSERKGLAPAWWWSRVHLAADGDPQLAPLRLFCRLRGIEIAYRRDHELSRRATGFARAVERADVSVNNTLPTHSLIPHVISTSYRTRT